MHVGSVSQPMTSTTFTPQIKGKPVRISHIALTQIGNLAGYDCGIEF